LKRTILVLLFTLLCLTAGIRESMAQARILPHPHGCPHRAFCGCGASLEIFGRNIRKLWLAANWFHFPRSHPAPNTAAVRRHHVMVLKRHYAGDVWWVYDANSGLHATRFHLRSIRGYTIVNPRA
jgi:hypothetical protein